VAYDEFRREYDAVHQAVLTARLDLSGLRAEIARLDGLTASLDAADRERAQGDLEQLRELLAAAHTSPPDVSPAQAEAMSAAARASDPSGTVAERLARIEAGIAEIQRIAAGVTDPAERIVVAQQAEQLTMLASALGRPA
jgi:multidrug resistance efflux pump